MSPVYWIVALLTGAIGDFAEKNPSIKRIENDKEVVLPNKFAVILLVAILVFVSGFRFYVGTDFGFYYLHVYTLQDLWDSIIHLDEPGIVLLSLIGNVIINSNQTLIFICALVTICLIVYTIYKRSPMFTLSMLLFLFLSVWHGSFNAVRQYLAVAIIFAGYNYIIQRKLIKYLIIIFIAFLFHKTALIMVVPYFLLTRKPDFKQVIILLLGTLVILGSYDVVFDVIGSIKGQEIKITDEAYYSRSVSIFRIVVSIAPSILYLVFGRKDEHTKEEVFFINATLFNTFTSIASMSSAYLARVDIYTSVYLIIGYAYLINLIKDDKTIKIVIVSIILLFFLFWYYSIHSVYNLRNFNWAFDHV